MQDKQTEKHSPAAVAREALRRLAQRRIPPTPDAYRQVYNEIAGIAPPPAAGRAEASSPGKQNNATADKPHLTGPVPAQAADQLRELLVRTLSLAVVPLLHGSPTLSEEARGLGEAFQNHGTWDELDPLAARLKQLCFRIGLKASDLEEERELLFGLFKLLLENSSGLLEDDTWLSGQLKLVQDMLAGPLDRRSLNEATRALKEVLYKQGMIRRDLGEAKSAIKKMVLAFIDRLAAVAASTGDYHKKIGSYSNKISRAKEIGELSLVLEEVMREMRNAETDALHSRDEIVSANQAAREAQARIHELETRLEQMSELVREDQLTGSLNRRGLDDVFERELARCERRKTPLCVAMLDLDDFKKLNDLHGHSVGDRALVHLVKVIKDTLRSMDAIARFGGEEFLILLPETSLADAMQTVVRLQRELTKRIFMYENFRVLITFSAGVAYRAPGEDKAAVIQRADRALYKAKQAGKNRVVAADQA